MASLDGNKGETIAAGAVSATNLLSCMHPYLVHDQHTINCERRFISVVNGHLERKHFVVDLFIEQAEKYALKPCVIYENTIYTFGDIDRMSNQFANFVRRQGLKRGDTIAMFMYNEPAYLWMYFGFAKLGISCAFINYNLRGESITKCLEVTGAKLLIVGKESELLYSVTHIVDELAERNVLVWSCHGNNLGNFTDVQDGVLKSPDDPIPREERNGLSENDVSVYIYTSGTTGHPKAFIISQRTHLKTCYLARSLSIGHDDRLYICLPLYHSSAFLLGVGLAIEKGLTIILSKKFSVRNFWDICRCERATIFLYIGELCRYLLSLPESLEDKNHSVRMAIGNGLRPDIWTKFQGRFSIKTIAEFYGATDGTFFSMNSDNTVGAVGKFSPLLKKHFGFHLVRCDYETAEPIRGEDGRCISVGLGEVGLLLSPVVGKFNGYSRNEEQTEKKLVKSAFKDGDLYCNMGDLMVLDKGYYLYFVDRIGDTFRWKGENVATTEVADIIGKHLDIKEVTVYGVPIPGQDGCAGMVALVLKDGEKFDPKEFYDHVTVSLAMYACPRFLRIMETLETSGTHKYKKAELRKQGFNPKDIRERMYYIDFSRGTYVPLNEQAHSHIVAGKTRM
ncbi:long-chain fatty acid transport protein 2-like [Ptychodera flava]|uniref:long-chain fatty acid transport protein 2-like n=1 Tax=Ptychodera flava TaxID=63121 RepID=UPI003969C35E